MAETTLYLALTLIFLFVAQKLYRTKKSQRKLPPSPPGIPIIGHLHLQKPPLHRTYHRLAKKYGPIFSLRYGSRLVVVVSSASAIEECFTKNDIILANRPKFLVAKHVGYNYTAMDYAPYGDHWRNLRRVSTMELLSNHRLNLLLYVRKEELKRVITKLYRESSQGFAKVELKSIFRHLTLNTMMRMITGKRYFGEEVTEVKEASEFKKLIKELSTCYDSSNPGDFFPIWNWIDGGRYEGKLIKLAARFDEFMQGIVDECRSKLNLESPKTLVNILLRIQQSESEYFTDEIIKGMVVVLLAAGTDTTSTTLEWVMTCLLRHPKILTKAKEEIDSRVGQNRFVDEPDVAKLSYLQNIISETLRLYPAVPVIDPHMASEDCTIETYDIPSGTVILANAWALHRDPLLWEDADTFKPERFEGNGVPRSYMPFGLGRRSCPGMNLALRVLGLTLATLIQCFEWEKVCEDEDIDMTEGRGITMPKVVPLEAMCKARPVMNSVLSLTDTIMYENS
ncbi:hypothetical protein K2173_002516 [Erythroxylum novogranatense]|uniref:Cytochrome P450 n=1 Tax=Erythroxylum novogranatense TaxID=1862640 RepID=A0AAV8TQR0_9ROSI|nr:hypothetical protein K2173_002516 [Erythroxylum novogranatense]